MGWVAEQSWVAVIGLDGKQGRIWAIKCTKREKTGRKGTGIGTGSGRVLATGL